MLSHAYTKKEAAMKGLTYAMLLLFMSLAMGSCAKKVDEGKIPITSSSDEAKKEFILGRDLAEKLLITDAIAHLDKAIALDPNFASAYLSRANVSFTGTDFFANMNKAVAAADKVSEGERLLIMATEANADGNPEKRQECLDKVANLYPNDERAHFLLGGHYFQVQDYNKAIEQYKKAVEINPNYSPVYNILGYAYRQVDNYPEAEKAFKKYTELIPNDPNPYDSYAELLLKMGRFDESIANYQKALSIDSHFVNSRTGIAVNYLYMSKPEKASAEVEKISAMARNDGDLRQGYFAQMVIYVDAGNYDQALQEAEKQYALGQKTNDVVSMSGDLESKGNILLAMGKYDDAIKAFGQSAQIMTASDLSQAIKENANAQHHYDLALVWIAKKDLKKANAETAEFSKSVEAKKNVNQQRLVHQLSGRIALLEKKNDVAIAELQQANQQNPDNLYTMALAYQSKGDKAKAKELSMKAAHFYGLPALNYALIRTKAEKLSRTM
jgi:tetratricopeptide (TPR) repeat protein